jgi:hypothetical protein
MDRRSGGDWQGAHPDLVLGLGWGGDVTGGRRDGRRRTAPARPLWHAAGRRRRGLGWACGDLARSRRSRKGVSSHVVVKNEGRH